MSRLRTALRWSLLVLCVGCLLYVGTPGNLRAGDGASYGDKSGEEVPVMPPPWESAPDQPMTPQQIDELIDQAHRADGIEPVPLTTDEQFIRRVTLDLTGKLPLPADVLDFVRSSDPNKRSRLIDELLASDDFCRRWARYWHDVIVSHATDPRIRRFGMTQAFENWLADQLRNGRNWGEIARAMITSTGQLRYDGQGEPDDAAAVFLLCHFGRTAAVERAAETSRVFLGIQIQCAQCHDHPSDMWKREQFHELAAFFSRLRERPIREGRRTIGFRLVPLPRGEYRMPDKDNPRTGTRMHPKFLTGESVDRYLPDHERRQALADWITSKDNYWFSAAFVNRVWGQMMGQAFYDPVDRMGPLQEATYPDILLALAASFRATDYDIRELYRTIANTRTYQRRIRLGDSPQEHLYFAAVYPSRLPADALWQSLVNVLGSLDTARSAFRRGRAGAAARFRRRFTPERQFKETFDFDPSIKADEVEGTIPQALFLMNNPLLHSKMQARGNTILARLLTAYPSNDDAITMLYLRTLARKPTMNELAKCRRYIRRVGKRGEAFEDILWALINSTEFQTKR